MQLNFVGKGSAFNPLMGNTGAYFTMGEDLFLLDCGESVFAEIWDMPQLKSSKNIYVLITHLHADHVGSLGSLISYCACILKRDICIVHPIDTIVTLLDLLGINREFYHYLSALPETVTEFRAEPVPVEHVDNMQCFGYVLRTDEKTIYYSGDAAMVPDVVLKEFLADGIDIMYQDTASYTSKKPTHCSIEVLEKLIPADKRSRVYCMHLGSDCEKEFQDKGFSTVNLVR